MPPDEILERDRELWTQEPFLISTFWFLGFNLQFTDLFSFSFPGASTIRYLFLSCGAWDEKKTIIAGIPFAGEETINFNLITAGKGFHVP